MPTELWLAVLECIKLNEFVPQMAWYWYDASTKIQRRGGGFDGTVCIAERYDDEVGTVDTDEWLVMEMQIRTTASSKYHYDDTRRAGHVYVDVKGDDVLVLESEQNLTRDN